LEKEKKEEEQKKKKEEQKAADEKQNTGEPTGEIKGVTKENPAKNEITEKQAPVDKTE
ncbi:MAG: hypothetical protein GY729_13400, partial [Desulfobacteraceae bacterium]|nr:hypothetical protein [Desulfobacteraceae bacterium]